MRMETDHSYEEIRDVVIAVLAGHEKSSSGFSPNQFEGLKLTVSEVFERREGRTPHQRGFGSASGLSVSDAEVLREVFWDLFRQGIITLGMNDANREFPWFRVSSQGERILKQQPFFPHDVDAYTRMLKEVVPDLHETTLLYLREAMSAFKADCLLSSSVMLGVAAEHTFLLLLEDIASNPAWSAKYHSARDQRTILQKFNKFRNVLEQDLKNLPSDVREDLETQFAGILSLIRTTRNESGHPTGKQLEREQVYVLLHLFVTYSKKMYSLRRFFRAA
jgi:hypothetical protein